KIKRGKHRVNIERLGPDDNAEPGVSGGYIFKKDHLDTIEFNDSNPAGFPTGGGGRRGGGSRSRFSTGPGGFPADPAGFRPAEGSPYQGGDGFFQRLADRFSGAGQTFTSSRGSKFFYVAQKAAEITAKQ